LARREGDLLVADRDVRPYSDGTRDFFIVSDAGEPEQSGAEHVLGVGQASLTLASLVPRFPVRRALDLGTGSGIQALHLATHCEQVIGTDISSEALECAALSAALSGVEIDLRHGSLFESVAGERFDLIVSNPPFVISPGKSFTYRDAGRDGDDFVRELVSTAHEYLEEGGWLVTLANWLHPRGRDWRERMMEWIAPTGCDAWVVQRERVEPAEYVRTWLADAGTDGDDAWLTWFEQREIEAIGFGWIVLRRRDGAFPHRRFEEIRQPVEHPMGPWVQERFDLADLAADLADEALLLVPMERAESTLADGLLQVDRGWRRAARIDSLTAELLAAVDPSQPVETAFSALLPHAAIDLESAAALVRGLLALGALRPSR
jgi:SAM-dependent methyltransferase